MLLLLDCRVAAADSVDATLQKTRTLFETGQFTAAIQQYETLLNNYRLRTREQIIETHQMLGAAYFHTSNATAATEHFNSLLNFDRQRHLDANYFSPKVVAFFETLRQPQADTSVSSSLSSSGAAMPEKQASAIGQPPARTSATSLYGLDNPTADDNLLLYRFIPFGVGQFKNRQPEKGKWFLGLEAATGLTAVAAWMLFNGAQNNDGSFSSPQSAELYQNVFTVSLISFSVLTIAGITDAVYTQQRQQHQETE